jgi:hypothetical protein
MTCMALLPDSSGAIPAASAPPSGAYSPAALQEAYRLAQQAMSAPAGGTDTVAVVDSYNDAHAASDLAVYRSKYGLPACTTATGCLKVVSQTGSSSLPGSDSSGGWELEESLDLDMVSAVCPHCKILLVEAKSDAISSLAAAEHYAVRHASAVSNSWGSGAEFVGESSYNSDFYAPGVAVTAAGGDDGYGTQYPAASPYVTSVGGTTLTGATSASPGHQGAWSDSGSGCSPEEAQPSWQTTKSGFPAGCKNRTDNDVSAVASPDPGVAVYDTVPYASGSKSTAPDWTAVGGTSVGTPLIAAAYALADVSTGKPGTGLEARTMPASYPYLHSRDFTDVTSGSDGSCEASRAYLCHARRGYDGPTGLGVPSGTSGLLGPAGASVTVLDPGAKVYQARTSVSLDIRVLASGGGKTALSATGLPRGLKVSGTKIAGKLTAKTGTYHVTVSAAADGAKGIARFRVVVVAKMKNRHPAAGQVKLATGGLCLTDRRDSAADGTPAVISACASRAAQDWEYVPGGRPAGSGELRVHGRCLTAAGIGNGVGIVLEKCTSAVSQRWQYQAGDQLVNPHAGRCLADHGSKASGTRVALWACSGGAVQSWRLPPAAVVAGIAGKCLTDPAGSSKPGTRAVISGCVTTSAQRWAVERSGTIRIRGRCLRVAGDSLADGAAVTLAACGSAKSQWWQPGPHGQLVNTRSGRCLTDPGNARTDGTRLTQSDCYAAVGQIWTVS